jgi:predicted porin
MIDSTVARLMATALTVAMSVAHGEVTVFGHGDASQGGLNDRPGQSVASSPECTICMLGVDGGNELGNGLKAIYRLDWNYDGEKSASRDQWLGISGNFGEVKVGTLSTRYKSEGVIPDPAYRASSVNETGVPSVQAGYKANINDSADKDGGVGLSYENAGVLIFADYISGKTAQDDTVYKVGAKYATENFAVFGQYKFDTGVAGNEITGNPNENTDIWFLGGSLTMGETSIYAGYGKGDDGVNASALTGYNSWEVVGMHSVGKLTSIYAGYSGTGCIDKNPDVCNKAGTERIDDDKFSLGIRHKF